MRVCRYPLESIGSPLYLFNSTFGRNSTTIISILYFLTAVRSQVRFDVSTGSVISRCCWQSRTSPLAMMLQKCTAILVLLLWLKSWPHDLVSWHQESFFHKMASIHHMNVQIGSSSVTFCIDCSHLPSDLVIWSKLPALVWTNIPYDGFCFSFNSDQQSSALPCKPASSCNCWFIIAKPYQVVSRLITVWPLIVPSSLKPMLSFVRLIHLFICVHLVNHMARLHVAPPR
jgi:hypothetical protein